MSADEMRRYLDVVTDETAQINEGILDSIKNWIAGLGGPVKKRGNEMLVALTAQLKSRYGATVPAQTQKSNKDWMWSKLSYKNLYDFAIKSGFQDADIDRALINPIVTNNLKQLYRTLPADAEKPTLPLKSSVIKTNPGLVSTTVDKQTKQYLSKAVAAAIIDGLAYIEDEKGGDTDQPDAQKPIAQQPAQSAKPAAAGTGSTAAPTEITADAAKQAVDAIKQYLDSKRGAA